MKKLRAAAAVTVLATVACVAASLLPRAAAAAAAGIRWAKSFKAARAESGKKRKPMLVVFYADWCGPCHLMEDTTFKQKPVIDMVGRFVAVRVNTDKEQELAEKYGSGGIPHYVIFAPAGKPVLQATGYFPAGEYVKFLKTGLQKLKAR